MKPAHRPGPVTEETQVLFVVTCISMYAFDTPLALRYSLSPMSIANEYIFECRPQKSVGGALVVSDLDQPAKVQIRVERVRSLEIQSVQAMVRNGAELANKVLALDVAYKTVRIGETEPQSPPPDKSPTEIRSGAIQNAMWRFGDSEEHGLDSWVFAAQAHDES